MDICDIIIDSQKIKIITYIIILVQILSLVTKITGNTLWKRLHTYVQVEFVSSDGFSSVGYLQQDLEQESKYFSKWRRRF